jgi:hypothetical protein
MFRSLSTAIDASGNLHIPDNKANQSDSRMPLIPVTTVPVTPIQKMQPEGSHITENVGWQQAGSGSTVCRSACHIADVHSNDFEYRL